MEQNTDLFPGLSLNQTEWENLFTANGIHLTAPPVDHDFLNFTTSLDVDMDVSADMRERRDIACKDTTARRVTKTETFLDWDIQMSNVACAHGSSFTLDVGLGRSITNTISVSGGVDPTVIKDWLKIGFNVDYSRSWTYSASNLNRATILAGNCGAMVLNPLTTRRYGTVSEGCIGSSRVIGTFMADDRLSANFNGVSWTGGAVSDCQRPAKNPPIHRCIGDGNLI